MLGRLGGWLGVALLAACGGSGPPGLPGVAELPEDSPPDTLLVVLEGIPPDVFDSPRLATLAPNLASFTGNSARQPLEGVPSAVTPAMATLLSGFDGHGLRSARELGFHRLGAELPAAIADARALGFAPVATVAMPQLDAALTGFGSGFEAWESVGTGSPRRTATPQAVVDRALATIERRLTVPEPVLALVQFSAPPVGEAGLPPTIDGEVAAAPLRAAAAELAAELGQAQATELIDLAAAGDLEAVLERVGRRRGSRAAACLDQALADLWLMEIDREFERLFSGMLVRRDLMVILAILPPDADRHPDWSDESFLFGLSRPGQAPMGLGEVLPILLRVSGNNAGKADENVTRARFAATRAGGDAALYLALGAGHAWRISVRGPGDGSFSGMRVGPAAPTVDEAAAFEAARRSDRVELDLEADGSARLVAIEGPRRGLPLWIELRRDGQPVPEADVRVGGRPLAELAVPRLLDARGAELAEPEDGDEPGPPLRFVDAGDGRLTLEGGAADLSSAHLAFWPPDEDGELPTVAADGALRVGAGRSLAVALEVDGRFAAASEMALRGRSALGPALVLVLPGYDDLELERRVTFAEPIGDVAPGSVNLWRPAPPFPSGPPITAEQRRFLRQLPEGE
ncbi:hypothetical protein [Engelhardtia mirabilis]|uniref:hypothetical protein n=1 Tax=Engelhardtia mirabilis TaxID=2528011 RepID=UPI0011AAD7C3